MNFTSKEELIRLDSICCECESKYCALVGKDGVCKAPFITGSAPRVTDNGCEDAVMKEVV